MKFSIVVGLILGLSQLTVMSGQRSFTRDGTVYFISDTPLERIEAINHKATCVLDQETGQVQIAVLIKSFHFDKALMEEHFNENYMESNKYPKAVFKGLFEDFDLTQLTDNKTHEAKVIGEMTIHGVTKELTILVEISSIDGVTMASSSFEIIAEDYNISIPGIVKENIAESIQIDVDLILKPLAQ